MSYQRITPPDSETPPSTELAALTEIWLDQKLRLEKSPDFAEYLLRQQREWAIETGIIERLYSWDREVTELLIEQGIDATLIAHKGGLGRREAQQAKDLIDDQFSIVEGLFSYIKGGQPLSEHFIRSLHAGFTRHQDFVVAKTPEGKTIEVKLWKGEYKKQDNNPRRPDGQVHLYCPPEFVQEEMAHLIEWYAQAEADTPAEIIAAWLHHRFTQIHPFQDGNGRVARALATLVFLRKGLFPLVVRDQDRRLYIEALEKADGGRLEPLVQLFSKRQRDSLLPVLGGEPGAGTLASEESPAAGEIIHSALDALKKSDPSQVEKTNKVRAIAKRLQESAQKQLAPYAKTLHSELKVLPETRDDFYAKLSSDHDDAETSSFFYSEIMAVAHKLHYPANPDSYQSWVRLQVQTGSAFEFVISFHGYGRANSAIMAVSAFTARRVVKSENGGSELVNVLPALPGFFQLNYAESAEESAARFELWLQSVIISALAEWAKAIV